MLAHILGRYMKSFKYVYKIYMFCFTCFVLLSSCLACVRLPGAVDRNSRSDFLQQTVLQTVP